MPTYQVTYQTKQKGHSKTNTTRQQAIDETHLKTVLKNRIKQFFKIIFIREE